MISRILLAAISIAFLTFIFFFGKDNENLAIAFMGSLFGGLFTLLGVYVSSRDNQRLNYSRFYLQFHKSQKYIEHFLRKSETLSSKLSRDRAVIRFEFNKLDFIEMRENIKSTILSINKEREEVDLDNFADVLDDINENAPLEYFFDLNFILISMVAIYNNITNDSKNLVEELPSSIGFISNSTPHQKQIKLLKRRLKKIRRKMTIK